jgi:hypothetical protein
MVDFTPSESTTDKYVKKSQNKRLFSREIPHTGKKIKERMAIDKWQRKKQPIVQMRLS